MRELLDEEGENLAVRAFLLMYGAQSISVKQMQRHMQLSGYNHWPDWVPARQEGEHLSKAGAQLWLRHLFALEWK